MIEDPSWLKALAQDAAIIELSRGLSLSEGFDLYLVLARTPRMVRAILSILPGGERLRHLDPYAGWDLRRDLPPEELTHRVLGMLLSSQGETGWVVDASRAVKEDRAAWAYLFGRMNERRNLLQDRLGGALVLCVPRELERAFAEEAPDLWSVRSAVLSASPAPPPARMSLLGTPQPFSDEMELREPERRAQLEGVLAMMDTAAESISFTSGWTPEWISPYVTDAMGSGAFGEALRLAQGAALSTALSGYHPSHWYQLAPYQWLSAIHLELGSSPDALAACAEGMVRDREHGEPDSVRLKSEFPLFLRCADVYLERGHIKTARELCHHVLRRCRRSVYLTDHHQVAALTRLHRLASSLEDMEKVHRQLMTSANQRILKPEASHLKGKELDPFGFGWLTPWHELTASVLMCKGDWHYACGDWERALIHYEDMAAFLGKEDPYQVPRKPWGRYLIIARYLSTARCAQAQALVNLDRAAEAHSMLAQAADMWQKLRGHHPLYPPQVLAEAQVLFDQARLAEQAADVELAVTTYRAAWASLTSFYPRMADNVLWQQRTRTCQSALARLSAA